MQLRRITTQNSTHAQVLGRRGWVNVADVLASGSHPPKPAGMDGWATDLITLLGAAGRVLPVLERQVDNVEPLPGWTGDCVLPFEPRSFRDFMLYERHAIDAARGFVKRYHPRLMPFVTGYEWLFGRNFPALRPHALWYREPVYYMSNHLNFSKDGDTLTIPSYTKALDYELELGFVLARGLLDATPQEAEAAIGGFVVLNDFSARDVQLAEMRSGFGPQKSKHFANAMSTVVVTADEILPHWTELEGYVRINDDVVATPTSGGACRSLGEVLAHASCSEQLHPGELFGTGTLPGGSGIEIGRLLKPGDVIEVGIDGIGSITNCVVAANGGNN